jgi:hypothetical protein
MMDLESCGLNPSCCISGSFSLPGWFPFSTDHLSCELLLLQSDGEDGSLKVDYFTFAPNLADYISSSALVISHAGVCIIAFHLNQKKTSLVGI